MPNCRITRCGREGILTIYSYFTDAEIHLCQEHFNSRANPCEASGCYNLTFYGTDSPHLCQYHANLFRNGQMGRCTVCDMYYRNGLMRYDDEYDGLCCWECHTDWSGDSEDDDDYDDEESYSFMISKALVHERISSRKDIKLNVLLNIVKPLRKELSDERRNSLLFI